MPAKGCCCSSVRGGGGELASASATGVALTEAAKVAALSPNFELGKLKCYIPH